MLTTAADVAVAEGDYRPAARTPDTVSRADEVAAAPLLRHVVERTAHYSHRTLHAASTGCTSCLECGLDSATIVDGGAVGLKAERPSAPRLVTGPDEENRKPTKGELEARVRELEAEMQRLMND